MLEEDWDDSLIIRIHDIPEEGKKCFYQLINNSD